MKCYSPDCSRRGCHQRKVHDGQMVDGCAQAKEEGNSDSSGGGGGGGGAMLTIHTLANKLHVGLLIDVSSKEEGRRPREEEDGHQRRSTTTGKLAREVRSDEPPKAYQHM